MQAPPKCDVLTSSSDVGWSWTRTREESDPSGPGSASMPGPTGEGKLLVMSTFPRPASSQDRDGGSVRAVIKTLS